MTTNATPVARDTADGSHQHVQLDATTAAWLNYISECDEAIKKLEEAKAEARKKVELMLTEADADEGQVDGVTVVTWKQVTSNRFQTTKFKEQHPDLYEQFSAPQISRRFVPVKAGQ